MPVPDTDTFSEQDVVDEINPASDDLIQCFAEADAGLFDPAYEGSKDGLLNFRNYGWKGALTYEEVHKRGPDPYLDIAEGTGDLGGRIFCVADGTQGLISYTKFFKTLTYEDNHFVGGIYLYQRVCQGGNYIYVIAGTSRLHVYSIDAGHNLVLENTYYLSGIYDICYQNNYLWIVGHNGLTNRPTILVYEASGADLIYVDSKLSEGDIGEQFNSVNGDGSEYVYITSAVNGVDSYHLVTSLIVRVDGDDQGDSYFDTCIDGSILLAAIGPAVGPRSYFLSSGNLTYKDEDNQGVNASGVHGLQGILFFVAVGSSGLYCYKINKITGEMILTDSDDLGGIYYKCVSSSGLSPCVYIATTDGVRVYSYV